MTMTTTTTPPPPLPAGCWWGRSPPTACRGGRASPAKSWWRRRASRCCWWGCWPRWWWREAARSWTPRAREPAEASAAPTEGRRRTSCPGCGNLTRREGGPSGQWHRYSELCGANTARLIMRRWYRDQFNLYSKTNMTVQLLTERPLLPIITWHPEEKE